MLRGASVELGDIGLAYLPVVDALRELADDPEEARLLAGAAMTAPGFGRLLPGIEPAGLPGDGLDHLPVLNHHGRRLIIDRDLLTQIGWQDKRTDDGVSWRLLEPSALFASRSGPQLS